jgi:hypothetical protein
LAGDQRPRAKRKKRRRKPGGQKGHDGARRPLAGPERVDAFFPILPPECKHCGHPCRNNRKRSKPLATFTVTK